MTLSNALSKREMRKRLLFGFFLMAMTMQAQDIVVGSKLFSESRLLCEIMAQTIEGQTDLKVERRMGLGGTLICFEALKTGAVDIYPEYTGTLSEAIFQSQDYEAQLDSLGILLGEPFGFNNTYVLITRKEAKLSRISDLKNRTDLKLGFSNEFVKRGDGYQAMSEAYGLALSTPKGMDH